MSEGTRECKEKPSTYYYGKNPALSNTILCDRTLFQTPIGFVLGTSGEGKEFVDRRVMTYD